jgi:hypothetical protein
MEAGSGALRWVEAEVTVEELIDQLVEISGRCWLGYGEDG